MTLQIRVDVGPMGHFEAVSERTVIYFGSDSVERVTGYSCTNVVCFTSIASILINEVSVDFI